MAGDQLLAAVQPEFLKADVQITQICRNPIRTFAALLFYVSHADKVALHHRTANGRSQPIEPRHPVLCPERVLFELQVGTWFVETIRASGHVRRADRPDTRPHLTIINRFKNVLLSRSHPHRTKRMICLATTRARIVRHLKSSKSVWSKASKPRIHAEGCLASQLMDLIGSIPEYPSRLCLHLASRLLFGSLRRS